MGILQAVSSMSLVNALLISLLLPLAYIFYNLFIHPLCHVPGPLIARISPLWLWYHSWAGDEATTIHPLHKKYGSILRVAPNDVYIGDSRALAPIYSEKGGFRTVRLLVSGYSFLAHASLLQADYLTLTTSTLRHSTLYRLSCDFSSGPSETDMRASWRHVKQGGLPCVVIRPSTSNTQGAAAAWAVPDQVLCTTRRGPSAPQPTSRRALAVPSLFSVPSPPASSGPPYCFLQPHQPQHA